MIILNGEIINKTKKTESKQTNKQTKKWTLENRFGWLETELPIPMEEDKKANVKLTEIKKKRIKMIH